MDKSLLLLCIFFLPSFLLSVIAGLITMNIFVFDIVLVGSFLFFMTGVYYGVYVIMEIENA